jgi:polyphosphate kinase 2 (PPK2 family)
MSKKKGKREGKDLEAGHVAVVEAAGISESANGGPSGEGQEPKPKMSRKEFEKELEPLQMELVKLQEWVKHTGAKICVVFEGRDTAGKGGIIKRITERTSPRVFKVVALGAPTEREKSQMYVQRYITCRRQAKLCFDRPYNGRGRCDACLQERSFSDLLRQRSVIINSGVQLIKYRLDERG